MFVNLRTVRMRLASIITRPTKAPPVKLVTVSACAAARYETPPARQTLARWCANGNIQGAVREGRAWYVPADATYSAAETNEWRIAAYGR